MLATKSCFSLFVIRTQHKASGQRRRTCLIWLIIKFENKQLGMPGCCACLNRTQSDGIIKSNPKLSKTHLYVCRRTPVLTGTIKQAHYDCIMIWWKMNCCLTSWPPHTHCQLCLYTLASISLFSIKMARGGKKRCILRYMQITIHQSICWSQNYHQRGRGCEVCNSPSTNGGLKLNPSSLINGKSATITWFV